LNRATLRERRFRTDRQEGLSEERDSALPKARGLMAETVVMRGRRVMVSSVVAAQMDVVQNCNGGMLPSTPPFG
jgi:hypothetical protein